MRKGANSLFPPSPLPPLPSCTSSPKISLCLGPSHLHAIHKFCSAHICRHCPHTGLVVRGYDPTHRLTGKQAPLDELRHRRAMALRDTKTTYSRWDQPCACVAFILPAWRGLCCRSDRFFTETHLFASISVALACVLLRYYFLSWSGQSRLECSALLCSIWCQRCYCNQRHPPDIIPPVAAATAPCIASIRCSRMRAVWDWQIQI